jgi:hypothetical protein
MIYQLCINKVCNYVINELLKKEIPQVCILIFKEISPKFFRCVTHADCSKIIKVLGKSSSASEEIKEMYIE